MLNLMDASYARLYGQLPSISTNNSKESKSDEKCLTYLKPTSRQQEPHVIGLQYPDPSSNGDHKILTFSTADQVRMIPNCFQPQLKESEGDFAVVDIKLMHCEQFQDFEMLHDAATLCQELESEDVEQEFSSTDGHLPFVATTAFHQTKKLCEISNSAIPEKKTKHLNRIGVRSTPCPAHNQTRTTIGHTHDEENKKQEKPTHALSDNQSAALMEPRRFDVVCGQSKTLNNRTGNRRFHFILDMYTPKYRKAKDRQSRMLITKEIIACIHSSNGRFVKYNKGIYEEISAAAARDKISHALRHRI